MSFTFQHISLWERDLGFRDRTPFVHTPHALIWMIGPWPQVEPKINLNSTNIVTSLEDQNNIVVKLGHYG